MKNKIIYLIIFIMLVMPLIFAATDTNDVDDIFKINTKVDYKKPCFNNGTYCSAAAICNFTIFNPDNTILIDNLQGTNQIYYHNITFSVIENGIYQADMTCIDGSNTGAETFYFNVTGNGLNDTVWFYALILGLSFGIMIMGFKLLDPPIVILGTFGLYFIGIYILRFGIVGIKDLETTWALGIIVLSVAFYISAKSSYELITG